MGISIGSGREGIVEQNVSLEPALIRLKPNAKTFCGGPLHPSCEGHQDVLERIGPQTHLKILMTAFQYTLESLFRIQPSSLMGAKSQWFVLGSSEIVYTSGIFSVKLFATF